MPKTNVLDMGGKVVADINLAEEVFGIKPNEAVIHAAVVNYLANQRQGNQSTLTRAEVRGGGRKPWRQKGTGRARQGSIRSPQWRHGGVALGPKPRSYRYSLNKKVRVLAMKSALSMKVATNELIVVDNFNLDEIKTKTMVTALSAIGATGKKVLIVLPAVDEKVIKSARNIQGVKIAQANALSVYDIVNSDSFVVLKDSVAKIEEVYAK